MSVNFAAEYLEDAAARFRWLKSLDSRPSAIFITNTGT